MVSLDAGTDDLPCDDRWSGASIDRDVAAAIRCWFLETSISRVTVL